MKITGLKLFFKSKVYRRMFFRYIRAKVEEKNPFVYMKTAYDVMKLYKDYPNRWERYVKVKEKENEMAKKAKSIVYTKFVSAIVRVNICLLAYCDYINRRDVSQEDYEKLYLQFDEAKKDFERYVSEIKKCNIAILPELENIVQETNLSDNLENCQSVIEQIYSIMGRMQVE